MNIWNKIPPQPHLSLNKNSIAQEIPMKGQINPKRSNKKESEEVFQKIMFGKNLISNKAQIINKITLRIK